MQCNRAVHACNAAQKKFEGPSKRLSLYTPKRRDIRKLRAGVLQKFDNKRLIIHTRFNDLFGSEKLKSEAGLQTLLGRIDIALRGLHACDERIDNLPSFWPTLFIQDWIQKLVQILIIQLPTNHSAYYS